MTGAAGSIGERLLPLLRALGWTTRSLVHRREVHGADECVSGDLADPASLRRAVDGASAVIHLAAVTHARNPRAYDVNVAGTRDLLASIGPAATRFVHVSSRAISPAGGAYSRSKLAAEEIVSSAPVPWVIVRLPELYGGGKAEGVDDIIRRARVGAPIPVVGGGHQELCPVHIDDVASALAAALTVSRAIGGTYTLRGECMTVNEFVGRVTRALGTNSRLIRVPRLGVVVLGALSRALPLPLYPDQLARLESPKAVGGGDPKEDLGFTARPLELALKGTQ